MGVGTEEKYVTNVGDYQLSMRIEEIMDPVGQTAIVLAKDIVHYAGCDEVDRSAPSCHARTLRKVVTNILQKHEILFNGMVKKLDITNFGSDKGRETFCQVADDIFKDGEYSWGRIVSLYAYAARLAKYCCALGLTSFVDRLASYVGLYIAQNLGTWIRENGGWEAFDDLFRGGEQPNFELFLWRGLVVTAMGLGALAATMMAAR